MISRLLRLLAWRRKDNRLAEELREGRRVWTPESERKDDLRRSRLQ